MKFHHLNSLNILCHLCVDLHMLDLSPSLIFRFKESFMVCASQIFFLVLLVKVFGFFTFTQNLFSILDLSPNAQNGYHIYFSDTQTYEISLKIKFLIYSLKMFDLKFPAAYSSFSLFMIQLKKIAEFYHLII